MNRFRIIFLSIMTCIFFISVTNSSFSQESLPKISDADFELLEELLDRADDLFYEENYDIAISFYSQALAIDPGKHKITVEVKDKVDNKKSKKIKFTVI